MTMSQKRFNSLSLMSIKHDILSSLNYENGIEDFANEKARKKPFKSYLYQYLYCFFMIIILVFL